MSKSTKMKHVVKELQSSDHVLPKESQLIVKLREGRGNNLHSVETADGDDFLVSMPSKFRKNVWVKRGDFLIVDVIAEGGKVRGEIATILDSEYVKFLKRNERWPAAFEKVTTDSPPRNNRVIRYSETDTSESD